jgi:hypothetical protein
MKHLLSLLALLAILTGCATTPQDVAYKTLEGSRIVVENATLAFGDYCRAMEAKGKPVSHETIVTAKVAFTKWKQASLGAGNALGRYLAAKATDSAPVVDAARAALDLAMTGLSIAQSEYITATSTP